MKLRHYDHDGRARFITICTHNRLPLLTNNSFRRMVIRALGDIRSAHDLRLLGYVVMPEHVHLVVVPPQWTHLGPVIGEMKRESAKEILHRLRASHSQLLEKLTAVKDGQCKAAIWQRRCYDHNCRTEDSVWDKVQYCHNNPVKRGLVEHPSDWRFSSYRWYHGLEGAEIEIDDYRSEE